MNERENDRFKPRWLTGGWWLKEGRQEGDWITVMMTVLILTAWETGRQVKSRLATEHPGGVGPAHFLN